MSEQTSVDQPSREAAGESRRALRGGRTIEYFVRGEGPPIVLAASLGREASDFNELAGALNAAGFRTLAVQAPGIGVTDPVTGQLTLDTLAQDVLAVVEADAAAGARHVRLGVGHAFGNRLIRTAASLRPDLIPAVALLAAGGQRPIPERAARALAGCFEPGVARARHLENVRYAFFADGNPVPEHWRRGWHRMAARIQRAAVANTGDTAWQRGGTGPMLVVQASDDRIAPKADTADLLQARFPERVRVEVVGPAGHALLPEQPEAVARALISFLDSCRCYP
ncbi:MAG TPA: alpha/beta hydrolase [Gammaproteobacteria bacterium]|nr:alpha/beta hydrolase [Gammaproteobacteria bacterium]